MRTIMILFTIILGMGVTAWALNDNKAIEGKAVAKVVTTDTYFEFVGLPGEEGDISKWQATTNSSGCGGFDRACKIKVRAQYLMLNEDDEVVIDPSQLPSIDLVPGADNQDYVPDPALAGGNATYPILSGEIHNRN